MIENRRDLGGIKTTDGKTIKKGYFVRSANLSQAEKEELIGISKVIDLRTHREKEESPDKYYDVEYCDMPIFDEVTAGISHEKEAEKRDFPEMQELYGIMVRENSDSFKKVLTTIMNHDFSSGAVLWHCAGGKDRCGLTSAFILEMLGVDRKIIMEDYLKTNETFLSKAEEIREKVKTECGEEFAEKVYRACIADENYLKEAWNAMGNNYFEKIGISKEAIEEFRKKVLD